MDQHQKRFISHKQIFFIYVQGIFSHAFPISVKTERDAVLHGTTQGSTSHPHTSFSFLRSLYVTYCPGGKYRLLTVPRGPESTEGLPEVGSGSQGTVKSLYFPTETVCNIFITYHRFVMEKQIQKVGSKSRFGSHLEVAQQPTVTFTWFPSNFKMAAEPTFRSYFSYLLFQNKPMVCLERVKRSKFDDLFPF